MSDSTNTHPALDRVHGRPIPPLLLIGAGRMGGTLFSGWCKAGLEPSVLVDPNLADGLARPQDAALASLTGLQGGFAASAVVLAVKPQMAAGVLAELAPLLPPDAVLLSILAGKTLAGLQAALGREHPVVRAMPNTPAAIGMGITAACATGQVTAEQRTLCDRLLAAVGEVAWLPDEALMDRITAVSGSGPAYVFLLAELLESLAVERGIPPDLARRLARRTVSGAGALLEASEETSADLRRAVTSPGGVTEKALAVLMHDDAWPRSIGLALDEAAERAGELGD